MTASPTRRSSDSDRIPALVLIASALGAVAPGVIMGLREGASLMSGSLSNPDSAMRLVRLNDILTAGAPLHAVMRDGGDQGTILHWSHFLDSLLLILAAPLAAVLGWPHALHLAGILSGPLSMGALGLAVAWAAAPAAPTRTWLWLGAFAAGAAPILGSYGMPGVVHHHVLLAVAAIMAGGWALRLLRGHDPVAGGVALGGWAAAGLWLSPEALPFALLALGAVWVAWIARPDRALSTALLSTSATLLLIATLAWIVDPPAASWMAAEPDRISLPFPLLALGAFLTASMAFATGRILPPLAAGSGLAILWLAAFPDVLQGTAGLMTPAQAAAFFSVIVEMQPVRGVDGAMESLLGGVFAAAALAVFAARGGPRVFAPLAYAAVCAIGLVALAATHVRFAAYPAVAGAVMLPIVLSAIGAGAAAPIVQSLSRVGAIVLLLGAPVMAPLAASAGPRPTTAMPCKLSGAVELLAHYPGAIVLAGVNETPDLLHQTQVRTVGSLYHRNVEGFMRLRDAWRSTPGKTPGAAIRATGATLVLGCPGEPRSTLVEGAPQDTLLDRLIEDRPPAWLNRIADAGPGGYVLYAVTP